MSEAFITGSQVYGKPTDQSDVDLVIRCSQQTADILVGLSDNRKEPIRFGSLNLIVCTDDVQFAAWKLGTAQMVKEKRETKKPFDSAKAKQYLDALRQVVGIVDEGQSGN